MYYKWKQPQIFWVTKLWPTCIYNFSSITGWFWGSPSLAELLGVHYAVFVNVTVTDNSGRSVKTI